MIVSLSMTQWWEQKNKLFTSSKLHMPQVSKTHVLYFLPTSVDIRISNLFPFKALLLRFNLDPTIPILDFKTHLSLTGWRLGSGCRGVRCGMFNAFHMPSLVKVFTLRRIARKPHGNNGYPPCFSMDNCGTYKFVSFKWVISIICT